jgi:CheY-like chemotaxis protein
LNSQEFDHGGVDKLRSVGGDALVRRLVRLFLMTSDQAMHRMKAALPNAALDVVQAAAHHLYASAAQLRLTDVADLARQLEQAARTGNMAAAAATLGALDSVLAHRSDTLRDLLTKLPQAARIAVVDDSEDVRVLLRLVFERHFDVSEYDSATSALLAMRRFPPDVVIIDVTLPDMSGVDLLEFMRADPALRAVPAVALTALAGSEQASFEQAGFALHIRKPVLDTDALVSAIGALLEQRAL